MATKVCSKCKIEKDVGEFSKALRNKDGLRSQCKRCDKEYTDGNKEQIKKCMKEYYENNKVQIKKCREEYYGNNKEQIKKSKKEYYENNKDRRKIYSKLYRNNNKIYFIEYGKQYGKQYRKSPSGKITIARSNHKRRDLIKKTQCTLTLEQWNKIIKMQGNKCPCGKPFTKQNPPTKDHIIPLNPRDKSYKNGDLTFENVRAVCGSCNSKKHNKIEKGLIQTWLV